MTMLKNFKSWQTTIIGVITAVLTILVAVGKISVEQQTQLLQWGGEIIAIISGLILMFFSQDPKKE